MTEFRRVLFRSVIGFRALGCHCGNHARRPGPDWLMQLEGFNAARGADRPEGGIEAQKLHLPIRTRGGEHDFHSCWAALVIFQVHWSSRH